MVALIFILILIIMAGLETGPSREEILEKGGRKEAAILYVADDEGTNRWKSNPTIHMEDSRSVKIEMDNVVISNDGKDRAFAYDLDAVLPWGQHLRTYSEYILYLTPKTLRNAGIILLSDENQTEQNITEDF